MSWSERIAGAAALACVGLALGGCGFRPLYDTTPAAGYDPALAAIEVRPVPDRTGQILVSSLREQLNPEDVQLKPRWVLTISMSAARADLGIRRDNTTSRGELTLDAELMLREAAGTNVVFHETIRRVTSFDLPDDAYAATVAEQKAREEAATELGREIAMRLTVYMERQRQKKPGGA